MGFNFHYWHTNFNFSSNFWILTSFRRRKIFRRQNL